MRIDIITTFPRIFESGLNESILKRAQTKGALCVCVHNLRDFTQDRHRSTDDRPYGGGPGMVMKIEPIWKAVEYIRSKVKGKMIKDKETRIILLTPQGKRLDQKLVNKLSKCKHLILICGHYEGVDERVKAIITDEISIGDYVLTGGELPALVITDAVARLLPDVLGNEYSNRLDTFNDGLLEYPQYTRPRVFNGLNVPGVLLSGDHKKIADWRKKLSLKKTYAKRPDLLKKRVSV